MASCYCRSLIERLIGTGRREAGRDLMETLRIEFDPFIEKAEEEINKLRKDLKK